MLCVSSAISKLVSVSDTVMVAQRCSSLMFREIRDFGCKSVLVTMVGGSLALHAALINRGVALNHDFRAL